MQINNGNSGVNNSLLHITLIIFCLLAFLIIAFLPDSQNRYTYLCFLPLGHLLAVVLSPNMYNNIKQNFVRLILVGGYTVRNVLTPLVISLGGYQVSAIKVATNEWEVAKAVILMVYETIIVFSFANYIIAKNNLENHTYHNIESNNRHFVKNTLFSVAFVLLSIFMVIAYLTVPTVMDAYQNLWNAENDVIIQRFSTIAQYSAGSIARILYAFFLMFFSVLQLLWSVYLIKGIKSLFGEKVIAVLLSFGIMFINTFFVSETSAYTIFVLVLLFMYMLTLFPNKRRVISVISVAGVLGILFIMITARTATYQAGNLNSISRFGTFLNAYFPGVVNVSVMWRVEVPSMLISLYYDLYKSIPLQSLIPTFVEGERLSNYFNYAAGTTAQILPFIGQTYFYLWIFGPIVQCVFIYFSLKWEYKAHYETNYIKYMALVTGGVIYASGCTMYDLTILLALTFKTIIPLFILGWLTNTKVRL